MNNVPATIQELHDLLLQFPDLCGKLTIVNEGTLRWDLWEGYHLSISLYKGHGHISLDKSNFFGTSVTHWHPDPEEMPEELRDIGTRGCILVVRRYLLGEAVVYMGPESECPPRYLRKGLLFRRLVLKSK